MDKFISEHGIEIIAEPNTQSVCEYLDKVHPDEFAGWVYALEYGDSVKIGCTSNILARIGALRNQARYGGKSIGRILLSSPCANYRDLEKECHRHCAVSRIDGTELFNTTIEEVAPLFMSLSYECDYDKIREERDMITKGLQSLLTGRFNNQLSSDVDSDYSNPYKCFWKLFELFQEQSAQLDTALDNYEKAIKEFDVLYEHCATWKKWYENAKEFIMNNIMPKSEEC